MRRWMTGARWEIETHVAVVRRGGAPSWKFGRRGTGNGDAPDAPRPDGPQPAPVRPSNPAGLSGGAEAIVEP